MHNFLIKISSLCKNKTVESSQICLNWTCVSANHSENQTTNELIVRASPDLKDSIKYSVKASLTLDNNQTIESRSVPISM